MSTIDLTDEFEASTSVAKQTSTVFFDPTVERYCALMRSAAESDSKTKTECETLLQRIERKCEWEKVYCISQMPMISKVEAKKQALRFTSTYTGFSELAIQNILLAQVECETIEETIRYRSLIRASINLIYTNGSIPTTNSLVKILRDQIPPYWCVDTLRKHLNEIGYTYKKLRGTRWRYLSERPEVTFKRFRYLKKIIQLREEGRPVFFIEENFYDSNGQYMKLSELQVYRSIYKAEATPPDTWFVIYAVSEHGVRISKIYDNFRKFDFSDWLLEELLPLLPEASVVVCIDGNRKLISRPKVSAYSTKADMMAYLASQGMPYREDMRKPELFELVEKVQDTGKASILEEMVRARGFEILQLPRSIRYLTPGSLMFEDIRRRLASSIPTAEYNAVKHLSKHVYQCFDCFDFNSLSTIAVEEKEQYETELKLEKVIERVEASFDVCNLHSSDLESDAGDEEES